MPSRNDRILRIYRTIAAPPSHVSRVENAAPKRGLPFPSSAEVGDVGDTQGGSDRPDELQNDDLVGRVRAEEGSGEIEGTLRTDVPESAKIEAVDPDIPFGEAVKADEAIRVALCRKLSFEELGIFCADARPIQPGEVVEGE